MSKIQGTDLFTTSKRDLSISIITGSVSIMLAQGLGIICGLGFDLLMAYEFGLRLEMDAFFVALALPQLLTSVLVSNGIRTLSPLFTETHQIGGDRRLYATFSGIVNYGIVILSGIAMVGVIGSPWWISVMAPGLSFEGKLVAVSATRVLFLSLVPLAVIEPVRAIHIFHERFFLATLANFFKYGAAFLMLLFLKENLGVLALGWAFVAGSALQVIVYGGTFLAYGGIYRPTLGRDLKIFDLLVKRLGPPVFGELLGQSNVLVERYFASFLSPGMISALGYGRRILVALNGLFINSVSVAILPRISLEAVEKQLDKLRTSVLFGTKLLTLVLGLVVALIFGLSRPLIELLFQRGAFDLSATQTTATIVSILVPSILFMGLTQLFMIPFFAFGETKIVLYLRTVFIVLYVSLSFISFSLFGGFGLAAALPTSLLLTALVWILLLSRRLKGFNSEFYKYLAKLVLVLVVVGVGLHLLINLFGVVDGWINLVIITGISILLGCLLYGLLCIWLGLISLRKLAQVYAKISERFFMRWGMPPM